MASKPQWELERGLGRQRLYTVTDEVIQKLEKLSAETGHNFSQLVRDAVMAYKPRKAAK